MQQRRKNVYSCVELPSTAIPGPGSTTGLKNLAGTIRHEACNTCAYASTATVSRMLSMLRDPGLPCPRDPVISWHRKARYLSVESLFDNAISVSLIVA